MINIIGTITGTSGYDIHTRQLAKALNKITDVRITTQVTEQDILNLSDEEVKMLKKKQENKEINLIITNPLLWSFNFGARNWVYLIWEGDRVPRHIADLCADSRIEMIIVPSQHTYEALANTVIDGIDIDTKEVFMDKVIKIPHGVDLDIFKPEKKPEQFTFIANKGFRNLEDRGGIQYLLKAYLEEFTEQDNVNLIVKINPAYGIPNFEDLLKDDFFPKNKKLPINIDIGAYKYENMSNLYNKGHVFISPTRAEAFNIPCLEAMACGLPVITTNFGGQTDYVNEENGWIIGGELTTIKHEIMYEGIKWLNPNIKELKQAMREAINGYKEKSEAAIKSAKEFTWNDTAKKILTLL